MVIDDCRKRLPFVKKVLLYSALALAAAGCVPGETVVTVTAADVECAMTGGVARAEVVMILTNSVPAIDPKKLPERVLKDFRIKAGNSPMDITLEVLKSIEESLAGFMPPGDTIKLSARPDGTNVLLHAHIKQNAFFSAGTNKLAACDFRSLRLHVAGNGDLNFFVDKTLARQRERLVGWMCLALCRGLKMENIMEDSVVGVVMVLENPLRVKTRKVRITGEGASRFRVDGTRISRSDAP